MSCFRILSKDLSQSTNLCWSLFNSKQDLFEHSCCSISTETKPVSFEIIPGFHSKTAPKREREIESFSVGNSTNRWQIIGRADDTGKLDMRWRLIGTFYQETTRLVIIH